MIEMEAGGGGGRHCGTVSGPSQRLGVPRLQGKGGAWTYTREQGEETREQNGDSAHGFLPRREIRRSIRIQLYLRGGLCAAPHTRSRPLQFGCRQHMKCPVELARDMSAL